MLLVHLGLELVNVFIVVLGALRDYGKVVHFLNALLPFIIVLIGGLLVLWSIIILLLLLLLLVIILVPPITDVDRGEGVSGRIFCLLIILFLIGNVLWRDVLVQGRAVRGRDVGESFQLSGHV